MLITRFVFKGKFNSIDSSEKIDLKKSILIAVVAFILTMVVIYTVSYIEYDVLKIREYSNNAKHLYKIRDMSILVFMFSAVFISAFEELVFRQVLFGYLYDLHSGCNKYVRFITSAIISSIIFGAGHDGVFHIAMIKYMIYGLSFSFVYFYTKRIGVAMAVHIFVNLFLGTFG